MYNSLLPIAWAPHLEWDNLPHNSVPNFSQPNVTDVEVNWNLLTSAFSQMGSQLGQLSTLMDLKKTKTIHTLHREGKSDFERVKTESKIF